MQAPKWFVNYISNMSSLQINMDHKCSSHNLILIVKKVFRTWRILTGKKVYKDEVFLRFKIGFILVLSPIFPSFSSGVDN